MDRRRLLFRLEKNYPKISNPIIGAKNIPLLLIPTDKNINIIEAKVDFSYKRNLTALNVRKQKRDSV